MLVALGGALTACGGGVPVAQPKLGDIQQKIFNNSCTFSSCHSESGHKGALVLTTGRSFAELVNKAADNEAANRAGKKRVVPGNPDASFLFQKVNRTGARFCDPLDNPACEGEEMPSQNERLPQQWVDAIRQWILEGAQNN
jgi:hypothetical protein